MAKNKNKSKSGGGGNGTVTIQLKKSSGKKSPGKKKKSSSRKKASVVTVVPQAHLAGSKQVTKRVHSLLMPTLSSAVARAVALPLSYNARVPDPWDTRETALANPYVILENRFTEDAANYSLMEGGTTVYAVSRDPLRWLMKYNRNYNVPWDYSYTFSSSSYDVNGMYRTERLDMSKCDTVQQLSFVDMKYEAGSRAYGAVQYPAWDNYHCWTWIDAKSITGVETSLVAAIHTIPTGDALAPALVSHYFDAWLYGASEPMRCEFVQDGAALGVILLKQSGYYRFSYTAPSLLGLGYYLGVKVTGRSDTFEFMPVPGFAERSQDIPEVRTVGTSLMLSPASTAMAEGGLVIGLQIPEGEFATTYLNLATDGFEAQGTLDRMLSARHAKSMDASKGIYGWHKPTAETDLGFQKPFIYNSLANSTDPALTPSGRTQAVGYRGALFPKGGWMLCAWKGAPNPTTGLAFPGCSIKVTAAIAMNFDTESVWYDVRKASVGAPLVEIRGMLEGVQQFTENPFHFKDITNWIRKNSDTLKGLAKKGLTALAGAFAPEALPLVSAINGLY